MDIHTFALRCFVAVAETKSFSLAARQVNRSQSAVSQQIAKLEQQLDTPLFIRGKTLKLSEAGQRFLEKARPLLEQHLALITTFQQDRLSGSIRFGLPEDFASEFLTDILIDFKRQHPKVEIRVECDLSLNLYEGFKQQAFDLVLLKMQNPADFPSAISIWSETLQWVSIHPRLTWSSTEQLPLVLSPEPCVYRQHALEALKLANIDWQLSFSSPSFTGILSALKADLGIGVLPKGHIPPGLSILKDKRLPKLKPIQVGLLKQPGHSPAMLSFEDFIRQKWQKQGSPTHG